MSLIVRDCQTGRPVSIPIHMIPARIQPDSWFEKAYWMHRHDRGDLEPLIQGLFGDYPLSREDIRRLAQYVVDYAGHIAVMAWMFSPPDEREETLEYNGEAMDRLRILRNKAETKEDVREMISVGMDYALDPF